MSLLSVLLFVSCLPVREVHLSAWHQCFLARSPVLFCMLVILMPAPAFNKHIPEGRRPALSLLPAIDVQMRII